MVEEIIIGEPQSPCMASGVIEAIDAIEDGFVLLHSPWGCKFYLEFALIWSVGRLLKVGCTGIDEAAAILGGEERIHKCILQVEKVYHPKLIALVNCCVGVTIGEDIEGVAENIRSQVDSEILTISSAGYQGDVSDGYSISLTRLADLIEEPDLKVDNSVNLVGWFSNDSNLDEMKRLLKLVGVSVNSVFTAGTNLDAIRKASNAVRNIIVSEPAGLGAAEKMNDRFGIPHVTGLVAAPYGIEGTAQWLRTIAAEFGSESRAERIIEEEAAAARRAIEPIAAELKGKRAIIVSNPEKAVPFTQFISELGMTPVAVGYTSKSTPGLDDALRRTNDSYNVKPQLLRDINYYQIEELLADEKPDVLLSGSSWNHAFLVEKFGVPLVPVSYPVVPFQRLGKPGGGMFMESVFTGFRGVPYLAQWIHQGITGKIDVVDQRLRVKLTQI